MNNQIFITATGTDVGKTFISALLVKTAREHGINCGYFKPVLSGALIKDGKLWAGDCEYVKETAKLDIETKKLSSYVFEQAVSPHLAARMNNVSIDLEKIKSDYAGIKANYDYMLTEGAGGIICPVEITEKRTLLLEDIIKSITNDVIIVSQSGLGSINSAVLTVKYAQSKGINVKGIILNNFDKNDVMHRDNLEQIKKLTGCKILCTVETGAKTLNLNKEELLGFFK